MLSVARTATQLRNEIILYIKRTSGMNNYRDLVAVMCCRVKMLRKQIMRLLRRADKSSLHLTSHRSWTLLVECCSLLCRCRAFDEDVFYIQSCIHNMIRLKKVV